MNFIQSFTHIITKTKHQFKEYERLNLHEMPKSQKIPVLKNCLKYYDVVYRIWKKMKEVFVMMNLVSVTVTME